MKGIEGEQFCYKRENDRVGKVLSILAVSNRFGWTDRVSSLLWVAFALRLQGFIVRDHDSVNGPNEELIYDDSARPKVWKVYSRRGKSGTQE